MISKAEFLAQLQSGKPLLSDGAMGTLLHERGKSFAGCFDELNLTQAELVKQVHCEYIAAGAQIVQTNTFGANRFKLARHSLADQLEEINSAGVRLAREAAETCAKRVLVAGDVGPLGVPLAPFGRVQADEARQAFTEQIRALVKAGVDLILIETMTDLHEIVEAIHAAREVAANTSVVASMTFTRDNRTLLGDSPAKVAKRIHEAGADVIGINCSGGPNQLLNILKQMKAALPDGLFSVMPNAGWPEQVEGRVMYSAAPEYFGDYAISFCKAGANMVGGCCGTTPAHIHAMANKLDAVSVLEPCRDVSPAVVKGAVEDNEVFPPTLMAQKLRDGKFVVAVEMDPPRGLSTGKLIAGASLLSQAGADVIDVADSPMARMRMSPWAVCSLIQRRVGIETVLHFPTRGRNLLRVQGDLLAAHALEVRNIFVVMGDPTAIGDYPAANDNYDLVPSGLIKLVKQGFNAGLDHAGSEIGLPTNFFVGCALNLNPPDMANEIKNLRRKLKAGADFILTQPIYSPLLIDRFYEEYEREDGKLPVPLIAGLLPLASARHAAFLDQEVPGIDIPAQIHQQMAESGNQGAQTGIRLTVELVNAIKSKVQGVYLMPAFSRFDHAAEIIEKIKD